MIDLDSDLVLWHQDVIWFLYVLINSVLRSLR